MTFHNPNQGPGPGSHPDLKIYNNEDFVEQVKAQILDDAEKFSPHDMVNPYASPLLLQFDSGNVELGLVNQFRDSSDRLADQRSAFVAKILSDESGIFTGQSDQHGQFLMISGASLEGTMTDDTIGVLAKDCSVSYRWAEERTILGMNTGTEEPNAKVRYVALSRNNEDSPPLRQAVVGSDSEQHTVFSTT